jgi:DNA-binding NarL/FixJ family response regulator
MFHKILIVDDNPTIRTALRSSLEHGRDWRVCGEAENGQDAVQKVRELHPDIVILDLQMPVMNGLDAGREITRIAPDIPLLMFTMHRTDELVRLAQATGIKEVITKSGGMSDLIAAVQNLISPSVGPAVDN